MTGTASLRARILVVDDESGVRLGLRSFLEAKGYEVEEAASCRAAEEAFRNGAPDAAILDFRLPDGDGVALVPRLRSLEPSVPLLVLTAHGSIELAVQAIKDGADQFLTKPVQLPALQLLLERQLEVQRDRRKQAAGASRQNRDRTDPFQGESPAIRRLEEEARLVLRSASAVLIQGETGTGKGVLARWLHDHGPRAEEAFVDLNCAGLSRDLLETELFGHETGAFTGAVKSKAGLLEVAHRGSVFLDEIGDVDPAVQPRLLKVLEERRFRRVGDVRERQVDVRLIAATHQDLRRLVEQGRFRGDLYYRIGVIPLRVPALRERPEDIPGLAGFLLRRCAREMGRAAIELAPDAEQGLREHSWPGNIRELRNVLEHAVLLSGGVAVRARDLRFAQGASAPVASAAVTSLREAERAAIQRALEAEGGHVERAARRLGTSRSSLYKRIRKQGISFSRSFDSNGRS